MTDESGFGPLKEVTITTTATGCGQKFLYSFRKRDRSGTCGEGPVHKYCKSCGGDESGHLPVTAQVTVTVATRQPDLVGGFLADEPRDKIWFDEEEWEAMRGRFNRELEPWDSSRELRTLEKKTPRSPGFGDWLYGVADRTLSAVQISIRYKNWQIGKRYPEPEPNGTQPCEEQMS